VSFKGGFCIGFFNIFSKKYDISIKLLQTDINNIDLHKKYINVLHKYNDIYNELQIYKKTNDKMIIELNIISDIYNINKYIKEENNNILLDILSDLNNCVCTKLFKSCINIPFEILKIYINLGYNIHINNYELSENISFIINDIKYIMTNNINKYSVLTYLLNYNGMVLSCLHNSITNYNLFENKNNDHNRYIINTDIYDVINKLYDLVEYCKENKINIQLNNEMIKYYHKKHNTNYYYKLLDYIKHNFKNFRSDIVNIKYELYGHINNEYHINDDIYNDMYLFYKKLCKIVSYYIDIVT
jgi:hypothetical protein